MTGWDIAIGAGAVCLGLMLGCTILVCGLWLADEIRHRRCQRRIQALRPVQQDSFPFIDEREQTGLYERFEEIVAPLRVSHPPAVPTDGGEPR